MNNKSKVFKFKINYLRDNSVISFRVLIEKEVCDLDVGLKLIFGAEAKKLGLFDL